MPDSDTKHTPTGHSAQPKARGTFRLIAEAVLYDERFRPLRPPGRSLWLALKLTLGPAGIRRMFDDELREASGCGDDLEAARSELAGAGLLEVEDRIHWLVDGYGEDRGTRSPKLRPRIERELANLGDRPIVQRFRERYGFEAPR